MASDPHYAHYRDAYVSGNMTVDEYEDALSCLFEVPNFERCRAIARGGGFQCARRAGHGGEHRGLSAYPMRWTAEEGA